MPAARNILITGGAKRIGRHIARYFAAKGYGVAIHCNQSLDDANEMVRAIKNNGGSACALSADLMDRGAVSQLVEHAATKLGSPIAYLVNNASIFEPDSIDDLTADSWDRHMSINALAPLLLTQSLAANLPTDQTGAVVNIIDQRVWRLNPTFMTYTASKSALWTLTQTTAQALAPRIRVNGIGPGPVLKSIHQSDDTFSSEAAHVPLERGPSLDEIAQTVEYLFSTPSMTGQMLALDGGQHLAWQTPDLKDQ